MNATMRDLGVTPARLVAVGFDTRPGSQRQPGILEVQHLVTSRGESPQRLTTIRVEHRPGFAYLWSIQSRHGRGVVEGDPDLAAVIHAPEFARAHDVLLGLLRNGSSEPRGDIFFVGSAARPWTWDASGRSYAPLFTEGSRRAFLRLRKDDVLWAEDSRLVAAPADALPEAGSISRTRSIFTAPGTITMLSKTHGRMGHQIVVTAGREQIELDLGENAARETREPPVTRRGSGAGLFIGHADAGRGLKALIALEVSTKGGWQLAIYPVAGPNAPAIATEDRV